MEKPHGHCHARRRHGLPELAERLRRKSRKLTGPRQLILEVLGRQGHPVSARVIFESLPKGECDLATIYRSLHLLESMGMIKHFDLGDGVRRFELLGENDDGHHHHLVCTRCERVLEVDDCFIAELQERLAATSGFGEITHRLEFFGICPDCQRRPK